MIRWAAALAFVAGLGCGERAEPVSVPPASTPAAPTAAPQGSGAAPPAERAPVFQRTRPLMGTVYQITVAGSPSPAAESAVDAAFDEIARLEALLSEWQPTSEVSRINGAAGGEPVKVGPDTLAVVKAGVDVSRWSGGAFDLSWAALHGLYDFRPGHHRAPTEAEIRARLPLIDWKRIVVDPKASTVRLKTRGMAIGTGGIGKGYALDRARDVLRGRGVKDFLIFGGGQVTVEGRRGADPWRVGIRHPRKPDYFAFLETTRGSIGTSGDYEHAFTDAAGKTWHHIIDTRTGYPAKGTLSVTLLAEDGVYADALSKPVFIEGPEKGLAFLAGLPVKTEAVIVDENFQIFTTPGTEKRLTFTAPVTNGRLSE